MEDGITISMLSLLVSFHIDRNQHKIFENGTFEQERYFHFNNLRK